MQKPFFGDTATGAPGPPSGGHRVQAERGQREVEVPVLGVEHERVGDPAVADHATSCPAALCVNSCWRPW